jgi:hypothetical protein
METATGEEIMEAQPFKCEVPDCPNSSSRELHVCTKHFIEGWGRLPEMPLPDKDKLILAPFITADGPALPITQTERELYISDKDKKSGKK